MLRFAAFLLTSSVLWAQGTCNVAGKISDANELPLAGAQVHLVGADSGVSANAIANQDGLYRFNALTPGRYRLEAEAPGFNKLVRDNVALQVAQTAEINLTLELGTQAQTVNIDASVPLTDTQSSSTGQLVLHQQIDNLPIPNRAAASLVALAPGVVLVDPGQGAENYPVFSIAGGRERNQNYTLDGGNVSNAVGLTRPQQLTSLPLDAMQEFRVIANNYAAEYGHSTGGIIAMSTRSGANVHHGSLFEYGRNDALDARNFFAATRPGLHLNQFGGALGGPIRRDKTHFFLSWEQTRQSSAVPVLSTVPTLAERQGDFSALSSQLHDPANHKAAFAGNLLPASRIDPVARAAAVFYPLPNRASASGANNYLANDASTLDRDIVVGRVDHIVRDADRLSARYYLNTSASGDRGSYGDPAVDPNAIHSDVRVQSLLGTYLHTFSPTLLNNLQATYLRRKYIAQRYGGGQDFGALLGLPGVSAAAFPTFSVSGFAGLGSQATTNSSIARIQTPITDTQLQDALSWFHNRHAVKAGVEYRRGYNRESNDLSSSGDFAFNSLVTGNAFASFLLGLPNTASRVRTDVIASRASYWAAYLQNDYRVTDRLTLNLGLRWEVEMPRYVDGDRLNAFDPQAINPVSGTPGVVTFAGRNGVPRTGFDPNFANFGPRLGFAYNAPVLGGVVVRGGAGIFYGPNVSNSVTTSATLGFADNVSLVAPQADTTGALQLAGGFPAYTRPALDTPGFGAVPPGQRPVTAVSFWDRHHPSPVSYQFNFNIQKEVVKDLLLEAGYIGNISHHLTANDLSINQVPEALLGPGNLQSKRPFPQFSNVTLVNPAIGNSTYHGVYIKAERRFHQGLTFLTHYTFSEFIDDVASGDEYGDPGSYMDQYHRRLDKGLSGSDVPQRAVITVLYDLRGWKASVYTTLQSGQPFTVYTAANTTNSFSAGPLRANVTGDPWLASGRTLAHYFNTAAFSQPALYTFGNSPRSVLRGPPNHTVDLSLARSFALTERFRTEIRGEFFNVLNIANFDLPGHTLGNADFGSIGSARAARTVEIALRLLF